MSIPYHIYHIIYLYTTYQSYIYIYNQLFSLDDSFLLLFSSLLSSHLISSNLRSPPVQPPITAGLPKPKDTCSGNTPGTQCQASSDRPNGCTCKDGSTGPSGDAAVCQSSCCDPMTFQCSPDSVCADECAQATNRTAGCTCIQGAKQCSSGCCGIDQTCAVDATACTHPCFNLIDRPNGCKCNQAGQWAACEISKAHSARSDQSQQG